MLIRLGTTVLCIFHLTYCILHLYFLTPLLKTSNFSLCVSSLLPSSLIIFTITTLNCFLSTLPSSTSFGSSSEVFFILSLYLKYVPLSPHFAQVALCIFMSLVGWLCFPTLEKWPFVGGILHIPAVDFPLVAAALCSMGLPCEDCVCPSVVVG